MDQDVIFKFIIYYLWVLLVLTRSCLVLQSEWEALQVLDHSWALETVEDQLMAQNLDFILK